MSLAIECLILVMIGLIEKVLITLRLMTEQDTFKRKDVMKRSVLFLFLVVSCVTSAFAGRGYVGQGKVNEIRITENSANCGETIKSCLMIFFEGGAKGCSVQSTFVSVSLDEPNFKTLESMAYISMTSGKKLRMWATAEQCTESALLNPNDISLYE